MSNVHATRDGPDIIVGGEFTEAGGVPANNLARWDGSNWTAFGSGLNGVAHWDGAAWQALGSGVLNVRLVNSPPLSVSAFAGTVEGLYVGGNFTRAGTRPANSIDLWTDYVPVSVAIDDGPGSPGRSITLASNYPNPFSQTTTFRFELGRSTDVTIGVFDLLGRRVATALPRTRMPAGEHDVPFDGSTLPPGMYVYRLSAGGTTESERVLVVR